MSKLHGKALPFRLAIPFSVRGYASQVPRRSLGFLVEGVLDGKAKPFRKNWRQSRYP